LVWTFSQLACAAASGFATLDENNISYLSKPIAQEDLPYTRFNDGGCDRKGRFFAGTLYNEERGIPGKLYCYDPANESCKVVDEGPFTVGFQLSDTRL
jgi:sugar lactone lactonase YvrE